MQTPTKSVSMELTKVKTNTSDWVKHNRWTYSDQWKLPSSKDNLITFMLKSLRIYKMKRIKEKSWRLRWKKELLMFGWLVMERPSWSSKSKKLFLRERHLVGKLISKLTNSLKLWFNSLRFTLTQFKMEKSFLILLSPSLLVHLVFIGSTFTTIWKTLLKNIQKSLTC